MKKLLIVFTVLLCVISNAQETETAKEKRTKELMSKKVEMDVDSELFMSVSQNTFVSLNPNAVVVAMYAPESYENAKLRLDTDMSNEFEVSDKGEKTINGVNVLYITGTSQAEGITVNNKVYIYKVDEETSIILMGILEVGADKKYEDAIDKALISGIKKQ